MPKALLYARINKDKAENIGVKRKLLAQLNGIRKCGIEADLLWYGQQGIYLNDQLIYQRSFKNNLKDYLFFLWGWDSLVLSILDISSYEWFYLRYALTHPGFLKFLVKIKSSAGKGRIILEFPTFPYDEELKSGSVLRRLTGVMDRRLRKLLIKQVDLAVHYGKGAVLNLPTLNLTNGIELEGTAMCDLNRNHSGVNIACVGSWNYWHGLDRLLVGVANFLSEDKDFPIKIKIIGQGPALRNVRRKTRELNLEKIVEFYPATSPTALVKLLAGTDFAVGALAMFRKGVSIDSSLKHREYCALGIPFILATDDPDFPEALPYVHYVTNDDTAIDVASILEWYRKLKTDYPNFQITMRKQAEDHLAWSSRMKTIFTALVH